MYQAEYISDGRYIIQDREYGYRLCVLDFSSELSQALTDEQMQRIANEIKDLIILRLNLEDNKDETTRASFS